MNQNAQARLEWLFYLIMTGILLTGCTTVQVLPARHIERHHIEGIPFSLNPPPSDGPWLELAKNNKEILESERHTEEREYYPSHGKGPSDDLRPQTGLALSGGGMRSAAFAIGVMSGLAKKHPSTFKSIDIMSSVSGGSYALSWYYMQQITWICMSV